MKAHGLELWDEIATQRVCQTVACSRSLALAEGP